MRQQLFEWGVAQRWEPLQHVTQVGRHPFIKKQLEAAGLAEQTPAFDALMSAAKTMVGAGVGGTAGAAVAFNADANNRQLHPDESRYIKAKAKAWAAAHPGLSLA